MSKVNKISPALISGLLCGLAYPLWIDAPTGFLMWFALVPIFLSLKYTQNLKDYFKKTSIYVVLNSFLIGHFLLFSGLKNWILGCFLQSILMFLPFLVHYFIQKKIGWRRALWTLPFVWTFSDWLQHLVPHSFQISSIAYTQTTVIWFAQSADIFGMWGISFWLIVVNASITLTIDSILKKKHQKTKHSPPQYFADFFKKMGLARSNPIRFALAICLFFLLKCT